MRLLFRTSIFAIPALTSMVSSSHCLDRARHSCESQGQSISLHLPLFGLRGSRVCVPQNGTGKTGAFVIPALEKINTKKPKIQALILVPTRELALQTSQVCKTLGKHLGLQVMVSTGGTNLKDDILRLSETVHILVGTPGRVLDMSSKGIADLSECPTFIMDEADKLLSPEFTGMPCVIDSPGSILSLTRCLVT